MSMHFLGKYRLYLHIYIYIYYIHVYVCTETHEPILQGGAFFSGGRGFGGLGFGLSV